MRENVGLSVPRFAMSVGANECISNGRGVRVDKSILLPHFWGGECPNTFHCHMVQDQNSALTRHDTFSMNHLEQTHFTGVPIPPQSHLSCLLLLVLRV